MVCREEEKKFLDEFLQSNRAEFLALYGRRRIGKTFLVREYFKDKPVSFFNSTGSKDGTLKEQITHFTKILGDTFHQGAALREKKSWDEVFEMLTNTISTAPKDKKIVLFFDEFPWMATRKSRLLECLDYYWNQYWSNDERIKLIICGSAASWIIKKIINNKGGLHNRITKKILLEPLNLLDTKRFLAEAMGITLNNNHILQIYMVTGGVPYYLTQLQKGLSATQNIEQLAFKKNGLLLDEFDNLFASLFNSYEVTTEIISNIASKRYGIGQEELFKLMGKNIKGETGLTKLQELEDTGFIMSFKPYKRKQRGIYYKVVDEYTLFYLRWIKPIRNDLIKGNLSPGYWEQQQSSGSWHSWSGLAFESVCCKHIRQISRALDLNASALPYTWRHIAANGEGDAGAQIDLLFDRADNSITLCEIKFSKNPFVLDKQCAETLENKKEIFVKSTKTTKQIFCAMIASNGLTDGKYNAIIDKVATLDDLFV